MPDSVSEPVSEPKPRPRPRPESTPRPSPPPAQATPASAAPPTSFAARISASTRRGAARATLQRFFQAYKAKDLTGAADQLVAGRESGLGPAVLGRAFLDEVADQLRATVSFTDRQVEADLGGITLEVAWTRISVHEALGDASIAEGLATVRFDRAEGMRISAWRGPLPFGMRDPQLREAVGLGAPASETPPPPPPPDRAAPSPSDRDLELSLPLTDEIRDLLR